MDVSIPINISTNAWNIIKFMAMYVLLDTTIPILLESIDKASIVRRFSCDGRVPISDFTKDRRDRSGVRELVTSTMLHFRKAPFARRSRSVLKLRPILLFSIWVASIIGEYGSGSGPKITQVDVPRSFAGTEGFLQALFTCVQVDHKENDTSVRLSVRNATMTKKGMRCSCSYPAEVGCTMPVQVERINVTTNVWFSGGYEFLSTGTVQVKKYYPPDTHNVYVLVQGHAMCNMCSALHMDPLEDIPFNVYGALDRDGKLLLPALYAGKLKTGTLVGLAYGKRKVPTAQNTLDDLFSSSKKVTFLSGVWERPGWKNRSFDTTHVAGMLPGTEATRYDFLENELPLDFYATWSAWWLRGHINISPNGTATTNTSSTETATISLLGLVSFPYVTIVFLILLVYSVISRKWCRALKTNGYGNVEWLISALIAQQQLRGSSLRGVDDFEQFDLTVVKNDKDVTSVSAQHWVVSLSLASATRDFDVLDGKVDPI